MHCKTFMMSLALALPLAATAQIYQWTDSAGTIHFDGSPPANQPYKKLTVNVPAPSGGSTSGIARAARGYEAAREKASSMDVAQKTVAAEKAEACAKAREGVNVLESTPPHRLMTTAANGEQSRLTDEQYKKELEEARARVRANCI